MNGHRICLRPGTILLLHLDNQKVEFNASESLRIIQENDMNMDLSEHFIFSTKSCTSDINRFMPQIFEVLETASLAEVVGSIETNLAQDQHDSKVLFHLRALKGPYCKWWLNLILCLRAIHKAKSLNDRVYMKRLLAGIFSIRPKSQYDSWFFNIVDVVQCVVKMNCEFSILERIFPVKLFNLSILAIIL